MSTDKLSCTSAVGCMPLSDYEARIVRESIKENMMKKKKL
jgi:hypothetical protein